MTTPAPQEEQDVPTEAAVVAAFVAAALLVVASATSTTQAWVRQLDNVLLPLLGRVHGGRAVEKHTYLAQIRPHLLGIDLMVPARAARTEYRAARHAGLLAEASYAAEREGRRLFKTWVTEHDDRVRPSHAALDGTTIEAHELFDVGGYLAPTPGWWTLPASERAACRCHLTFDTTLTAGASMPQPIAAGVALIARDTRRVLMLQRCLCDNDPDGGTWEFPGGRLEDGETVQEAAIREFQEETGVTLADLEVEEHAVWTSPDGIYRAYAFTVGTEAEVMLDGTDQAEDAESARQALAWWPVSDLPDLPALRPAVRHTPWQLLMLPPDELDGMDDLDEAVIELHNALMEGEGDLVAHQRLLDMLEAAAYAHEVDDDDEEPLVAAGGADRNRGNAERLRRYWTTGPGGQRIQWRSPGDFRRCVSELTEHLGARAKGYCALRHKEQNGFWPGDRKNLTAAAEGSWDGSSSRFTDEQWKRSTILHLSDSDTKADHKLPIREPNGALSRAGVHAAASRLNQVDAPAEAVAAARRALRAAYKELDEDAPEALTAAGTPYPGEHIYDDALFQDPRLDGPTPLTVDGTRVYGHVATWDTCHVGYTKQCRTAPRSRTGYSRFHVGEVMTASGPLAVGNLVLATGHAGLGLNLTSAADHYARSGSAVAVVRAGEDRHGIWVAGSIIEGTPAHMVAALRRCPLSGDWRDDRGSSEMVAALAVNVPGLPIPREQRQGGRTYSLVAAGVVVNPEMERVDRLAQSLLVDDLAARVLTNQ